MKYLFQLKTVMLPYVNYIIYNQINIIKYLYWGIQNYIYNIC